MNEREGAVNQDLQVLGDAYRLGQIAAAEYRMRRRNVLATLRRSDTITARKVPKAASTETVRNSRPGVRMPSSGAAAMPGAMTMSPPSATARNTAWRHWLLFAVGVALVAALIAMLLASPDGAGDRAAVDATSTATTVATVLPANPVAVRAVQ